MQWRHKVWAFYKFNYSAGHLIQAKPVRGWNSRQWYSNSRYLAWKLLLLVLARNWNSYKNEPWKARPLQNLQKGLKVHQPLQVCNGHTQTTVHMSCIWVGRPVQTKIFTLAHHKNARSAFRITTDMHSTAGRGPFVSVHDLHRTSQPDHFISPVSV